MNAAEISARARAAGARLGAWALRRARERSTWAGAAMLLGALGKQALSTHVSQIGDAVVVLLGAGGVGLAAATTSPHAPAGEP